MLESSVIPVISMKLFSKLNTILHCSTIVTQENRSIQRTPALLKYLFMYFIEASAGSEEEKEKDEQDESEDDDVQWYKEEVGEEPDEGRITMVVVAGW